MNIEKIGRFIAATENAYDFTDRQSGERVKGSTCRLWFSWSETEEPAGVRVRAAEDWEAARHSLEFGDLVSVEVEVQARNSAVQFYLVSLERSDAETGALESVG